MQKIWIFIGRMNPPHLWHLNTIKKSIEENDKTIVFLWSANIKDSRNPYSFKEREKLLDNIYVNEIKSWKLIINLLNDQPSDKKWVNNLYSNITNLLKNNNSDFNIYCWDKKNDYAIKAIEENINELNFKNIKIIEISRKNIDISSTTIRELIDKGKFEKIKNLVDNNVYNYIINK